MATTMSLTVRLYGKTMSDEIISQRAFIVHGIQPVTKFVNLVSYIRSIYNDVPIEAFTVWYFFFSLPYTLYPIPFTLYTIPYTLYPMSYTLYSIPFPIYPIPFTSYPILFDPNHNSTLCRLSMALLSIQTPRLLISLDRPLVRMDALTTML